MRSPENAQSLVQSLVEKARSRGATAADAALISSQSTHVEIRDGALEDVGRSEAEKIGLRFFIGQKLAAVAGSDFSANGLDQLVDRAAAMAREATEDEHAGLAPEEMLAKGAPADLALHDGSEPDAEALRARALAAERAMLAVPGVTKSSGASASTSGGLLAIATSHGFSGAFRSGGHGLSVTAIAGEGGAKERDYAWHNARHLEDLRAAEDIGREAGERTVARLNPGKIKAGTMPVIFDARIAVTLLNHVAAALSGSAVARRASFLQDKMGEQVFGETINITDDPLRPRGLRSHPFDGEGLPVRRMNIVENGMVKSWFAASAAARQLGISPTGHAVRGTTGSPGAGPSNFWIQPGKRSREELLAAFPRALLVTELIGQGVNGVTGDYSRGAAGFIVEGGEIGRPVSEITIASNLKTMFRTLEPGSDLELWRGTDSPSLLIPEMTVASA